MNILSLETSCDETAAAVIKDGQQILSNVVVSQIDIHASYGGVVPEIAARSHIEAVLPVVHKALEDAKLDWPAIDAIAVTHTPGLLGSLLVGTLTARTLAILHKKPLYAVHHIKSHIYANWLTSPSSAPNTSPNNAPSNQQNNPQNTPEFPLLALVISGGHTQLIHMQSHNHFEIIGTTNDDAVGEVFDKVAKILGLPYPGGPAIAKVAEAGDPKKYQFPHPKLQNPLDFSFSGPKTAVLRTIQSELDLPISTPSHELAAKLDQQQIADFAASFQETAIAILAEKLGQAFENYPAKSILIAGGVSANQLLRQTLETRLKNLAKKHSLSQKIPPIFFPAPKFSTDNAAMVGAAAFFIIQAGQKPVNPYTLDISPRAKIT